jgi:hypothetical protein
MMDSVWWTFTALPSVLGTHPLSGKISAGWAWAPLNPAPLSEEKTEAL